MVKLQWTGGDALRRLRQYLATGDHKDDPEKDGRSSKGGQGKGEVHFRKSGGGNLFCRAPILSNATSLKPLSAALLFGTEQIHQRSLTTQHIHSIHFERGQSAFKYRRVRSKCHGRSDVFTVSSKFQTLTEGQLTSNADVLMYFRVWHAEADVPHAHVQPLHVVGDVHGHDAGTALLVRRPLRQVPRTCEYLLGSKECAGLTKADPKLRTCCCCCSAFCCRVRRKCKKLPGCLAKSDGCFKA